LVSCAFALAEKSIKKMVGSHSLWVHTGRHSVKIRITVVTDLLNIEALDDVENGLRRISEMKQKQETSNPTTGLRRVVYIWLFPSCKKGSKEPRR
jgi:hypothetical protein